MFPPTHAAAERVEDNQEALESNTHEQPSRERSAKARGEDVDLAGGVVGMDDVAASVEAEHFVNRVNCHGQQFSGICHRQRDEERAVAAVYGARTKHDADQQAVAEHSEEGHEEEEQGGAEKDRPLSVRLR